jgi:hypothetical protein
MSTMRRIAPIRTDDRHLRVAIRGMGSHREQVMQVVCRSTRKNGVANRSSFAAPNPAERQKDILDSVLVGREI